MSSTKKRADVRTIVSAKFVDAVAPPEIDAIVSDVMPAARLVSVEQIADIGDVRPVRGGRTIHHYDIRLDSGKTLGFSASCLFYEEYDVLIMFDVRVPIARRIRTFFSARRQMESPETVPISRAAGKIAESALLRDVRWYFKEDFDRDFGETWSTVCRG